MTDFEIHSAPLTANGIRDVGTADPRVNDWPAVYVLHEGKSSPSKRAQQKVYVGETLSAQRRLQQHMANPAKASLTHTRVILHEKYNKSAALDLEAFLIRMFSGDGHTVENRNEGIVSGSYYAKGYYQRTFEEIFDRLHAEGLFVQTRLDIINKDLYKFSPFKVLSPEQDESVRQIAEAVLSSVTGSPDPDTSMVVSGGPGTGKTVLAIVLLKLLADLATSTPAEVDVLVQEGRPFSDLFTAQNRTRLAGLNIGIVVPQQSLRESLKRVFKKTPGLRPEQVLDPFAVGKSETTYDLLIVDEAHRLNQRANQSSGGRNRDFADITTSLFGADDLAKTQLDWVRQKSRHQVLIFDPDQTVRPADLPTEVVRTEMEKAEAKGIHFPLTSQLRVNAGDEYVGFFGTVLRQAGSAPASPAPHVKSYDLRMFTDLDQMRREILRRDEESGLSRLLAGYAWAWKSRKDPTAFDIEVDGLSLRWNSTDKDWVNSTNSLQEVGSIHTIQGYDLNYAGVIIGPDIRMDPSTCRVVFHRESYFDKKGMENNPKQNRTYTDADIREYVINIYNVLLTRGIKGTYLYVCDEPLREYLAENYFPEIMNGATVASFVGTTLRADSFHADPDPRVDYEGTDHGPGRDRIWREGKSLPDLPPRKSL